MKCKTTILFVLFLLTGWEEEEVLTLKDLNQNRMDLRIYQENLGEYSKANEPEEADWLLEGMDSILRLLSSKFKEHPKLAAAFSYYDEWDMQQPVSDVPEAIRQRDSAKAIRSDGLLINHCNDCHIDHEINKEVRF